MPIKLNEYQQRTSVGTVPGTPNVPVLNPAGQSITQIGQTILGVRKEMVQREDQDAVSQARVALSQAHLDAAEMRKQLELETTENPDGFTPTYLAKYDEYASKAISNFSHPAAKRVMVEGMASLRANSGISAMQFEATQTVKFRAGQADKIIDNYSKALAADPESYEALMFASHTAIDEFNVPAEFKAKFKESASARLRQAASLGFAIKMPYLAQEAVNRRLGIEAYEETAPGEGKQTPQQTPAEIQAGAQHADRLYDAMIRQESGGVHMKDGKLLTSSAGAEGISQLMPATAAKPGYGIPPLRDQSKAEFLRVGRAYFDAMRNIEFPGEPEKAVAAYNAGPQRVKNAVEKYGGNWLQHMPKETRDYVEIVSKRAGPLGGTGPIQYAAAAATTMVDVPPSAPVDRISVDVTKKVGVKFIDDMDGKELLQYKTHVDQIVHGQMAVAQSEVRVLLHNAGAAAERGEAFNMPDETLMLRAFGPKAKEQMQHFTELQNLGNAISDVGTQTPDQMMATMNRLRPASTSDPLYAERMKHLDYYQRAAQTVMKARYDDPIAAARMYKIDPAQPIEFGSPNSNAGPELKNRDALINKMQKFAPGASRVALDKNEVEVLSKTAHSMSNTDFLNMMAAMKTGLVTPSNYYATVRAVVKDNTVAFTAVDLYTRGPGLVTKDGKKATDVAYDLAMGDRMINPDKYAKSEDGKRNPYKLPPLDGATGMNKGISDRIGAAFIGEGDQFMRVNQNIYAYYAALSAKEGVYNEDIYNVDRLNKAISHVVGEKSRWAGSVFNMVGGQQVLMPWGMREDEFRSKIMQSYNDAVQTQGINSSPSGTKLQRINEFEYGLQQGGVPVTGKNGKAIILNIGVYNAQP
jgi:soluble lytic murein transglycosylase